MAQQLSFDWPVRVSVCVGDFFVSAANEPAFAMVTRPRDWPFGKLCVVGPTGCGKSHLAQIFAEAEHAAVHDAAGLGADIADSGSRAVIIEDMEHLPRHAEEAVFHLHNRLAASGQRLLLTAATPPAAWPVALPDLASRLQATTVVRIGDPDDRLLAAVLMKHFADRQLAPPPAAIPYLTSRIERSFAAASRAVARIDAASLGRRRELTLPFIREVLDADPDLE